MGQPYRLQDYRAKRGSPKVGFAPQISQSRCLAVRPQADGPLADRQSPRRQEHPVGGRRPGSKGRAGSMALLANTERNSFVIPLPSYNY